MRWSRSITLRFSLIFLNPWPHRPPLPRSVSTSGSRCRSKHHVVGGLAAKNGGAEVAPHHFELIGDMLPRGIDVGERLAERLLVVNAGRAGGAHPPRRKLGAAVRDRCRLEFVL